MRRLSPAEENSTDSETCKRHAQMTRCVNTQGLNLETKSGIGDRKHDCPAWARLGLKAVFVFKVSSPQTQWERCTVFKNKEPLSKQKVKQTKTVLRSRLVLRSDTPVASCLNTYTDERTVLSRLVVDAIALRDALKLIWTVPIFTSWPGDCARIF